MARRPKLKVFPATRARRSGPTCVDLFSGAGGLAEGFREAGWAIVAGSDADPDAGATFRLNFAEAAFFQGPISALKADRLLAVCGLKRGQLDALIGGPPCQSFSYNNHQRSADNDRARLFRDYLRLVAGLLPKTLVMENVPGILTIGENGVISEIERKLAKLEYRCAVKVLSAEEFGTPQIRKRVFILATRTGDANELVPVPTHRSGVRKGRASESATASERKKNAVTVLGAIGDLPILRSGGGAHLVKRPKPRMSSTFQLKARKGTRILANHICHALSDYMLKRLSHVPEGGNWRDIPRRMLPAGMKRARLTDHTKRYGRLARKGLASTILTKCDPHWGAYVHPTQNRTISVREAARLQGFPDSFVFAGEALSKQYMQVGNAVPVPLANAIGNSVQLHLNKRKRLRRISLKRRGKPLKRALSMRGAKQRSTNRRLGRLPNIRKGAFRSVPLRPARLAP